MAQVKDNPEALKLYQEAGKMIQDETYHVLARSNLRSTLHEHIKHLITIADGAMRQDGYDFELFRLDNYVLRRDRNGEPMYAIIREFLHSKEIPEEIRKSVVEGGGDTVPRLQDDDLYPLYTELTRNEDKSWDSVQYINEVLVPDSELHYKQGRFPYYFSRWNADPYDDWGTSLVEENFGDILAASAIRQTLLEGAALASSGFVGVGPGQLTPEMVDDAQAWQALPLDRPDSLVFIQPDTIQALTAADSLDQRMQQEINRIFLMDVSAELTHERTTATQVIMAAEELNRATGGFLSNLDRSTMRNIILTTINQLVDDNVFTPEITDLIRSGDIVIDVKSGVEALGREGQYRNVASFIAEIAQISPEAVNQFNMDAVIRWAAAQRGIPGELLKTDVQKQQDQQAALQQQLQSGVAEQLPQVGGEIIKEQVLNG